MLQIIAGRSGSGKTEIVYNNIFNDIKNGNKVIFIVPEQSSFQSEKSLLEILGEKDYANVEVLSFSRLCDIVREKYGEITKNRIDDGIKAVITNISIESVSEKLNLYKNRSKKNDFTELMMDAINEYKMSSITPEDLINVTDNIKDERLKEKIKESAIIYSAYNAKIESAYTDPSDDLTRLYKTVLEHMYFKNKIVYIDAFNGYSGQEQHIVECIITQAQKTVITVACEYPVNKKNSANSIFAEPETTYRQLNEMARKNHIEILPPIYLDKAKRFKEKSLSALEESFYRYDGFDYEIDDNAVSIYEAENEYEEIEQVARYTSELVINKGYEYRDIVIICRNPESYKSIIESTFLKYDIPYFMSNPQKLEIKPLFRLVLSAFDVIHSSFNTEKLFVFLKTGLTLLDDEEIFKLENYAYMWNIKGIRWKSPFTMSPNGNMDNNIDIDLKENEEELTQIEQIREKAIIPLMELSDNLSKAEDGAEMAKSVYKLLEKLGTAEKLKNLIFYFSEKNEIKEKEEETNLWDILMDILGKIYIVLKGSNMDSKRFRELLELMIRKNDISDIPQTLDQITVGTAGNIRVSNPKIVFVIGAVENIFPAVPLSNGIFSDNERCELIMADLPLHNSLYELSLKEKYNVYAAISSPTEKLFISYYKTNIKNEQCEPSSIVREIMSIIKNIHIRNYNELSENEIFRTERQSLTYCAECWNDNNECSNTLKKYFSSSEKYKNNFTAIKRAVEDTPYEIIEKENIHKVFGKELQLSASKIETYHKCPFAYFCKYGLSVLPRKKIEIDAKLYGTIVHYVFENIIKNEGFEAFMLYNNQQLKDKINIYVDKYIQETDIKENNNERFKAMIERMKQNVLIVTERLVDEFKESKFIPVDFELEIKRNGEIPSPTYTLPTGEKVELKGKIDRVDIYKKDNNKYIRVVDYKTGTKSFNLFDIIYGLNTQMLLYLHTVQQNGQERYSENNKYNLVPAGVLYMPSTPDSKKGEIIGTEEELLKDRKKNFKLNGILINDQEILNAMENGIQGNYIPATLKNGEIKEKKNIVEIHKFEKIFQYIDDKIINMSNSIYKGKIPRNPVKGAEDACKYCEYKSVCGFEEDKQSNIIQKIDFNTALKEITGEDENNG